MEIQSGDIVIREYQQNDLEQLIAIADNTNVSRWLTNVFPSPYTREDGVDWLKHCSRESPVMSMAVTRKGVLVGGIGLGMKDDIWGKTGEIGYWLGEPFWRMGICSKAVSLYVKWCFEEFELERIEAQVHEDNRGSAAVLEKCGFAFEGVMRNRIFKNRRIANALSYSILKEDVIESVCHEL